MPDTVTPSPVAPRFRWPMGLFLSFLVFNMVFRSLAVLVPWDEWRGRLDMDAAPWRLPTRAEMDEMAARTEPGEPSRVAGRVLGSFDDVWEFFKPWPAARTRDRIRSWGDGGRFAFCWVSTRYAFLEDLCGVNQEWPMFSPNVSDRKALARAQLVYADGSRQTVRLTADPPDLTRYAHWFEEKVLDYELKVKSDAATRRGYCNLLAYRHPRNEAGAELKLIYLHKVYYYYPRPGEDAAGRLRAQNGPPPEQTDPPFFAYEVAGRRECYLDEWRDALLLSCCGPTPAPVNLALAGLFQRDAQMRIHGLDR